MVRETLKVADLFFEPVYGQAWKITDVNGREVTLYREESGRFPARSQAFPRISFEKLLWDGKLKRIESEREKGVKAWYAAL